MLLFQLTNFDFGLEITAFGFLLLAFRNRLRVTKSVESGSFGYFGKGGGGDEEGGGGGGGGGG